MRYILAHDLGTSGNKATLFSEDGRLIKSEVFSYDAHYFNDTWVEQNADDWWNAVCRTSSSPVSYTHLDVYKRQDEDGNCIAGSFHLVIIYIYAIFIV